MLILFLDTHKSFVSDITIILILDNSYDYLLKLLQINVCVCVNAFQVVFIKVLYVFKGRSQTLIIILYSAVRHN